MLFGGESYDFDEHKFVFAASTSFKQSGHISFEGNKTIITYSEPKYKQIINDGIDVTIIGKSGKFYKLKGKGLFYTKLFIDVMARLGDFKSLTTSKDFIIDKKSNIYIVEFSEEMKNELLKAEVVVDMSKVKSFKLFMKNGDTLEIIKK
jgi:hypothetical protein